MKDENLYQIHEDLVLIHNDLICIQNNLCASDIMHDYKQSFDDIQTFLTAVDRDMLHELAKELKNGNEKD